MFAFEIIQVLVIPIFKKQYTLNFGKSFTNNLYPSPKNFKYVT